VVRLAAWVGVGAAASTARASGAVRPTCFGVEGRQGGGEELPQQRAQLHGQLLATPDRVLLSAGQHRDRLDQLGVRRQGPVGGRVGAQDACQHDRVGVVGLGARHTVPIPVAGHGQGVDGVHAPAGGAQEGHQQAAAGLDGDRDGLGGGVASLGQ
jgi:hypothetical protein